MEKLKKLQERSKATIYLHINPHLNGYMSIDDYLTENLLPEDILEIDKKVVDKIYENDTLICLTFYPDTPVGFYKIIHYDLDKCLEEALGTFNS